MTLQLLQQIDGSVLLDVHRLRPSLRERRPSKPKDIREDQQNATLFGLAWSPDGGSLPKTSPETVSCYCTHLARTQPQLAYAFL